MELVRAMCTQGDTVKYVSHNNNLICEYKTYLRVGP